jgi:SPP1 family predicted phage head-tail adaptor
VKVGALRHPVTLQGPGASVPDGDGGWTSPYTNLSPAEAWAEIKPATARDLERVAAGTVMSTASHLVTIRYRPDVTTQTRVVFGARQFSVTGVMNPEEKNEALVMLCVEIVQ